MHSSYKEFMAHGHGKYGPWFDLVNSQEWDRFGHLTEHFQNPAWLPFFLRRWGFTRPKNRPFPFAKWAELRAALRSICEAAARHSPLAKVDVRVLNRALKVAGTRQLHEGQNGFQLEFVPSAAGWDEIRAETARSFAEVLTKAEVSRIKICRNPQCGWVFYDQTKGKTRCWCNDKVCGNRARVRKARLSARNSRR